MTKPKDILSIPLIAIGCILVMCSGVFAQDSPVSRNGRLQVQGARLCNAAGEPVQLRGLSSHGIQWFPWGGCLNEASLDAVAGDWSADLFRVSLYVDEGGYKTDPSGFASMVNTLVEEVSSRGLYVIIDWHILNPGDPWENLSEAVAFFDAMSKAHGHRESVIYEICNEPNGVPWSRIKSYAEQIIPVIRANDPQSIIVVGTPAWSSLGISEGRDPMEIVNNALTGDLGTNVMYAFHFYAASHTANYRDAVRSVADAIPLFVTEWGAQTYSGDGVNDVESSGQWLSLMEEKKISWAYWNFSDDWRSGAVFQSGTCPNGPWTGGSLKESGRLVMDWLGASSPTSACSDGLDNDGDGLVDLNDPGCETGDDNDESNATPTTDKTVVGYFPGWGIYYDFFVKDIDASKVTHINYAFINVIDNEPVVGVTQTGVADAWGDYQRAMTAAESVDGVADTWDQPLRGNWNQLRKLKQRNPHVKILASLGGWTWSGHFSDAALPENREAFVAACIDRLILGNLPYDAGSNTGGPGAAAGVFDGIDIDWEYPVCCGLVGNTNRPEDKQNYTALLAEFRSQLDAVNPDLLLTIAAPAGPHNIVNYEVEQLPQYLDFINVMTYDLHGAWDSHTGFLAPLYPPSDDPYAQPGLSVSEAVETYLNRGVPRDELIVGLPFYGRSWTGVPPGPDGNGLYQSASGAGPGERDEPGMLNYYTINDSYLQPYDGYVHPEIGAPWLYNGTAFISYDDQASIRGKAEYILQQNLGGAMVWTLMSDVRGNPSREDSLLYALWDGLHNEVPPPVAECSDGVDNDGDGFVDLDDPGCTNAEDDDETNSPPAVVQCNDGIDNDGDGLVDLDDPGCENGQDDDETNAPPPVAQCSDGLDNDGDGLIDLADPGCEGEFDDDEANVPTPDEVDVVLETQSDWGTGYCANGYVTNNTAARVNWVVSIEPEGAITDLWNGVQTPGSDGTVEVQGASWNASLAAGGTTSFGFCANRDAPPPPPVYACGDGVDNDGDGFTDLDDPGCDNVQDDDEWNEPPPPEFACGDGVDNDGDGLVDLEDPGCESADDDDEYNDSPPVAACSDGQDNDGDGLVDMADPGCESAGDDDEFNDPEPGGVTVELSVQSDWGSGYCADVTVRNSGSSDVDWEVTVPIEGRTTTTWNAVVEESNGKLHLQGLSWNNIVPAGGSVGSVGFCAQR